MQEAVNIPERKRRLPAGNGEMAERIRTYDWASTPLGPIETWPQSRKTVVDLMLGSQVIMAAPWGPDGILLYNDAYARLLGPRGATALGRPVFEALPELRELLEPQFAEVRAGRTLRVTDFLYPFVRTTTLEDAWFDISYTPVRDEEGRVAAVLGFIVETTERVLSGRRQAEAEAALRESEKRLATELSGSRLLQRLSTRLIPEQSPEALYEQILDTALELMRADAVSIQLLEEDGKRLRRVATRNLHPDSTEYWTWVDASHASTCGQALSKNERVVLEDVEASPELTGTGDLEAFRASGTRAVQSSPLLTRTGRPVGMISTHWRAPRQFDESDFGLFDILARQVADLLERARAGAALRASEERQAFLLAVGDAMRAESAAEGKIAVAARLLGEKLNASRVLYAEYDHEEGLAYIFNGWLADGAHPFPSVLKLEEFEGDVLNDLREGRVVRVDDVSRLEAESGYAAIANVGVQALLSPPLLVDGKLKFNVSIHQHEPRHWSDDEVALVQEVSERLWAEIVRARAETALAVSEEKYRTIFDSIDEGFALIEVILDDEGKPVDLLHIETNPAYERHTGLRNVAGKRALEIAPAFDGMWFDFYGKVARTGEAARTEYYVAAPVDRWFTLHASRVGGEGSRKIAVVFNDITDRKGAEAALRESEERQAFLLKLSDALRAEPDADAMALFALQALAERLQLDRCYIAEYRLEEDRGDIRYQFGKDRVPPFPGSVRLSDFPEAFEIALGGTLIIDDVNEADFLSANDKRNMHALGIHGLVTAAARQGENVPLFCIVAVSAVARHWTSGEIMLIEEVNERTWVALERARAEAALRESEERYRTLFESIDEGVTSLELLFDEDGNPVDWIYLDTNPAIGRLSGLTNVVGKKISQMVPVEQEWLDRIARVARTGKSERFEQLYEGLGRWFDVYLSRIGGEGSNRIVTVYNNITERKRAEAALRESEERQAFLLKLSDALRPVSNSSDVRRLACRLMGEHLSASRVYYVEYRPKEGYGLVADDYLIDGLSSLAARYPFEAFRWTYERISSGTTWIVSNVVTDEELPAQEREFYAAQKVIAWVNVPLVKDGTLEAALCIVQTSPRSWTAREIRLIEETAERMWSAIQRGRAEAALRESEARFQQFADASSGALWIRDADTLSMEYVSPAMRTIYGIEPDALLGDFKRWAALVVPDDRDAAIAHIAEAKSGDAVVHEFRIQRASDGAFRWIRNTDFPLFDEHGSVQRIGGIAEDVTEAKLATEHTSVLLAELQHRVRNIMALTRSITARTGERAQSVAEYTDLMLGRLMAFARVQSLLTRAANVSVGIASIVRDEVSVQAHHKGQYVLEGPDIELSPKAAEVLTLAVHELATNAVKYGALSAPDGKVGVTWSTFERRGVTWLSFDWTEEGAPERPKPSPETPRRRGFGSELIEGRIPYELKGKGTITIESGGARCHLEFPLTQGASILGTDAPQRASVFGGALDMTGEPDLDGRRVLVVEDDYYLATDAVRALQGARAEVIGPCATEEDARIELKERRPDAVVLDVNLGPGASFKLAEHLKDDGIPFVFVTGYDQEVIPAEFDGVERLEKPVQLRQIVGAISRLLTSAA